METFADADLFLDWDLASANMSNNAENSPFVFSLEDCSESFEMETGTVELDLETIEANIPDDIFQDWDPKSILEENNNEILSNSPSTSVNEILELSDRLSPPVQERRKTKRAVGRPPKTEPTAVTVLPVGKVSKKTLEEARYRRMRDLNNIASKNCRLRRKEKQKVVEEELRKVQEKNIQLKRKKEKYELLKKNLTERLIKNDIPIPARKIA